mmetsp:Transcript_21068/g.58047  ORF Transcript_21068/g.58047 Transcript_21068/m.58047 type:complete len:87 (+) Transcript_21068:405-665(+)
MSSTSASNWNKNNAVLLIAGILLLPTKNIHIFPACKGGNIPYIIRIQITTFLQRHLTLLDYHSHLKEPGRSKCSASIYFSINMGIQ